MIYALVVVAAFMFGMYNVFIKLSSSHIDAVLGAVVLQFIAALIGLALLIYMKINGSHIFSTPKGIGLADRKSTRLNSSHVAISYAVFCLKKKKNILYDN